MAVNKKCVITGILAIFILATIISAEGGGATGGTGSPPAASSSPKCAKEYISVHLNETATRTKEFVKNNILKRLHDPKTLKTDRPCLMRFFQAYHAAIASIEKASQDFSKNEFSDSVVDVVAYGSFVGSTMKLNCSSDTFKSPNSDFSVMLKWAERSVSDLLTRLIICTNISTGDAFAEPK